MDEDETGTIRDDRALDTALLLMRSALPLLDGTGRGLAAARLQHAIDAASAHPPSECAGAGWTD